MACPRCQAANEPDAQFCFNCGYPLAGAHAGQQPSTTGGYRPGAGWSEPAAGAWPAPGQYGAPPQPYGAVGQAYQPGPPSRPMQPSYPSQPVQPDQHYPPQEPHGAYGPYGAPGSQTYGGQQPYPLDEPEDNSRSPLTAVLIGGIVILLIAITGGAALLISRLHAAAANTVPVVAAASTATATPTPTPTPTATPTPAFMTYTDPGGSYRLLVPTDWVSQTSQVSAGSGIVFETSDGMAGLGIQKYNGTFSESALITNEKNLFAGLSTGAGGPGTYSHLQGPTTVSFAGEIWVQESADVAVRDGITLYAVVQVANHADYGYVITCLAEPTVFNTFNTNDFQPMERSFRFLP